MIRLRLARVGDALFLGFLAVAFLLSLTDGFRIGRGWYRISATDPTHAVLVAIAIGLIRHALVRRPSLRERLTARRVARRSDRPDLDLSWPSRRDWLLATVAMTAATLVLLKDQVATLSGVPDRGDPLFSMWRLAWVAHQIVTDPAHLFDANIFHPATNTLAYSDATLLSGLIVAPFLWAGAPLAIVHGLLFVASFGAAGMTMFVLARAVVGARGPALFAGLLFAFWPYRFATYSHLEMQGVFLMPLALLFLLRALRTGTVRDGVWLGIALALQTLWSFYLGAYLAVGLAAVVLIRWASGHFEAGRRRATMTAAAVIVAAVVVPYSYPYWVARETVGDRPRRETQPFSAEPIDFISNNGINRFYFDLMYRHIVAERQLFPGMTTPVLAAAALVPPVAPVSAAAGVALVVAVDATLGMNGVVFRWLYDLAPPFRAFRVPARFGTVVGLFATLLAGAGFARLLDRTRRAPARRLLSLAIVAFALLELRPTLTLGPTPTSPPAIYASLPADPGAVIVDIPLPEDPGDFWTDPTYLYYSTFHWRRLINGYSGFMPDSYPRLMVASREMPSDDALAVFRAQGAQYLVLHEEFYPRGRYAEIAAALERRGDVRLLDAKSSPAGECRLYRLLAAAPDGTR